MEIGHSEYIQYCKSIAAEFEERLKRMEMIVDYKLRSGTAYAEILRSFLDEHSAGKYKVGQGFIVNPFVEGKASKHCDILVYDQVQYPLLDVEGDVKVILPRAASMVIEVEPYLDEKRLVRSFDNIRGARKVYPYLTGIIFAINGSEPQVLYETMVKEAGSWQAGGAPIAVINMENGFVAHREKMMMGLGGGDSPFEVYELTADAPSETLELLFLLYFEVQMHGMLAPDALQKAWKYLLAAGKANFLGKVCLGK